MIPLVLVLMQVPSVSDLLSKVDGKDVQASFQAIADLADLGPAHRAEIERDAARLEPFWRDALLAELAWPAPALRRVSLGGEARLRRHLEIIRNQSDLRLLDGLDLKRGEEPISIEMRNARALDALGRLCEARDLEIERDPVADTWTVESTRSRPTRALALRNVLLLHRSAHIRKWIDLVSRPEWHVDLDFTAVTAPGVRIAGWKDPIVVEAVSENGIDLRAAPRELSIIDQPDGPQFERLVENGFSVRIRRPEGVQKAARLRFQATARAFTEYRTIEIAKADAEGLGRTAAQGVEVEFRDLDVKGENGGSFAVRVSAKEFSGIELSGLPVVVDAICASTAIRAYLRVHRTEERAVTYEGTWAALNKHIEDGKPVRLTGVRVHVPGPLVDRPVYAEFRDIPLK